MRIQHVILIIVVFALVVAGCNTRSDELEKENAELQQKTTQLNQDLEARDQYIEDVTQSINEIYANLEGVREKEKNILRETGEVEGKKKVTSVELRQRLLQQIATIDTNMRSNRKKLSDLQARVSSSRKQYAGLQRMMNDLKKTLEEREQSIAQLQTRVQDLENEVQSKTRVIAVQDSTINDQKSLISQQTNRINTGYYIIGSRKELEEKGIISDEGGFLWGLLGSTTVLSSGVNPQYFKPIDKTRDMTIEVQGDIDEIIPRRSENFYVTSENGQDASTLQIVQPDAFWQENYLVIITD